MGRKKDAERGGMLGGQAIVLQVICMSVFCAVGMAIGHGYAGSFEEKGLAQLSAYLRDYCALYADGAVRSVSLLAAVRLYFLPVLLAFLFGFSRSGLLVLPLVSAAYGFVMAFSVACFLRVYGRVGLWPALAVFGPRAVITVPCFLWVAAYGWSVLCAAAVFFPGGKRTVPLRRDGRFYYCFCVCIVLLMAGVCAECYLVPHLFRLALEKL